MTHRDVIRLTSDMENLDARLEHEAELDTFRDDNGHLLIVPGKDGFALAVRPGSNLERIVRDVRERKN
jgi:hypothetical protein